MISKAMTGHMESAALDINFPGTDVDQCADIHLKAAKQDNVANQRFLVAKDFKIKDLHARMKEKYPNMPISQSAPPLCLLKCFAMCDSKARYVSRLVGRDVNHHDHSKAAAAFNMVFREPIDAGLEMA